MKYLRPFLSGYLGVPAPDVSRTPNDHDTANDDDLSTMFLHQRCCCHVLNLGVNAALDPLKAYIDDFRTAIIFLNASNQYIAAYKSYCMRMAVRPRKFGVDMDVRWNSTYLMLKHLLPYKSTFSVFIKTQFPIDVRTKLTKIYNMYESKFGDARLRAAYQPAVRGSGKKKMAWGDIYDDDDIDGVFPSIPLGRKPCSSSSSPHASSTVASTSELASYLDSDILTEFDEDFNILSWWQKHRLTYPILSLLAKDVLTVPASTISSESTFSLAGRVIEERRRRLTHDMVEVLSCIKDWELTDANLQHSVEEETNKLEEVHENMYLDVDDAAEDEG
ncbi:hypothetical protein U9M48_016143 [Paspalum notatum var. saurae]|uniref:HAT C-terminal dimerisation domain-containing protein n=1 Tax=Paspalum notatum var. saurae TaxID=547442 RepID=A0AAQ3WMS7_PASNO